LYNVQGTVRFDIRKRRTLSMANPIQSLNLSQYRVGQFVVRQHYGCPAKVYPVGVTRMRTNLNIILQTSIHREQHAVLKAMLA